MKSMGRKSNMLRLLAGITLTLIFLSGCHDGKIVTKRFTNEKMIHYTEISQIKETENPGKYAVYINQGEKFPVKLSVESDLVTIAQDHIDLVAQQKLYFYLDIPEDMPAERLDQLKKLDERSMLTMEPQQMMKLLKDVMLFVSRDGEHWAPVDSKEAMREVLGYKEGRFALGIDTKGKQLSASFLVQIMH